MSIATPRRSSDMPRTSSPAASTTWSGRTDRDQHRGGAGGRTPGDPAFAGRVRAQHESRGQRAHGGVPVTDTDQTHLVTGPKPARDLPGRKGDTHLGAWEPNGSFVVSDGGVEQLAFRERGAREGAEHLVDLALGTSFSPSLATGVVLSISAVIAVPAGTSWLSMRTGSRESRRSASRPASAAPPTISRTASAASAGRRRRGGAGRPPDGDVGRVPMPRAARSRCWSCVVAADVRADSCVVISATPSTAGMRHHEGAVPSPRTDTNAVESTRLPRSDHIAHQRRDRLRGSGRCETNRST